MSSWTAADMPDQAGRTALVTGANSGIGYYTSLELARHGAHVIMIARNRGRGEAAVAELRSELPAASVELRLLDLADLDEVRAFAMRMIAEGKPLDLLINNAGLMMPPRGTTKQGFETQFGVNHLAHFALTLALLELMAAGADARVVTVSSGLHKSGSINFGDLQSEKSYSPTGAYSQSKIANVYFGLELDRRLRAMGSPIKSVLAHPGVAATNLTSSLALGVMKMLTTAMVRLIAQSPASGALPTLYAAIAPGVSGGEFFGPDGFQEMRGSPVEVHPVALANDRVIARRLWEVSEQLTGVTLVSSAGRPLAA